MIKEKVFFIESNNSEDDPSRCEKLKSLIQKQGLFDYIGKNELVAVKSHVGEGKKSGFVRPVFLKMMGDIIKDKKGEPFLTETSTLYMGNRSNAVRHSMHSIGQGFGAENIGYPFIPADGLFGDEEMEVKIPGKIYKSVNLAALIVKANSLIMVSHFTGHLVSGFGAALKNMGMGCASRKGKMIQHSTMKPAIIEKKCTMCNMCVEWCPEAAITMEEKAALIDPKKCIGCGQCLAVCQFGAVKFNWGTGSEDLQKKIVEHAWGVDIAKKGKVVYINFLTRMSKDCDCMDEYVNIADDIGILASFDPVAIDAASIDLFEKYSGKKLSEVAFDLPYRHQIDYAREIGFGNAEYEIVKV